LERDKNRSQRRNDQRPSFGLELVGIEPTTFIVANDDVIRSAIFANQLLVSHSGRKSSELLRRK
jgi:hypothetical protein